MKLTLHVRRLLARYNLRWLLQDDAGSEVMHAACTVPWLLMLLIDAFTVQHRGNCQHAAACAGCCSMMLAQCLQEIASTLQPALAAASC
jgi:hypothetical protein